MIRGLTSAQVEIHDPDPDTDETFRVPPELLQEETPMPDRAEGRAVDDPVVVILREELAASRKSRDDLTVAMKDHDTHAGQRHHEMMGELRALRKDLAVEAAADDAVKAKAVAVLDSAWKLFRGPLATLTTAAVAYAVAHYLGLPPTPTPVAVSPVAVEVTSPAATAGPSPLAGTSPLPGDGP